MPTFAEKIPAGWRLRAIVLNILLTATRPSYTCTLEALAGPGMISVAGTDPIFEDAVDFACQRAREMAPIQPYLCNLASVRRDEENRWVLEDINGRIAGSHDPAEAVRMLGLTLNPY
jgi:hypothetical protein